MTSAVLITVRQRFFALSLAANMYGVIARPRTRSCRLGYDPNGATKKGVLEMARSNGVRPKGMDQITFSGIKAANLHAVVNIETAQIRISPAIPGTPEDIESRSSFTLQSGDGDGDYPVLLLRDKQWMKDPDAARDGWGFIVPFYRGFYGSLITELAVDLDDGERVLAYLCPLGYLPDRREQYVCGSKISYVGDLPVAGTMFVSDAMAYRGSGDAIVDVPLHGGLYRIFLIEDSGRDQRHAEYFQDDEHWQAESDYDVVRSLVLVHEDKVGFLTRKAYPLERDRKAEIEARLADRRVIHKADIPRAFNAVEASFWISLWGSRWFHAMSWLLQGLLFPDEQKEVFLDILANTGANLDAFTREDFEACERLRGLVPPSTDRPTPDLLS